MRQERSEVRDKMGEEEDGGGGCNSILRITGNCGMLKKLKKANGEDGSKE